MKQLIQTAKSFKKDVSGAISAFSVFVFLALLMIGGLAVDVASLYEARTQLQVAADSAAHAAIYSREVNTPTTAKSDAMSVAQYEMPSTYYGTVITASDIEFGDWDSTKKQFTADPLSDEAVRVNTKRISDNANPVSTFLLKLVGVSDWDVQTPSVFETFIPSCMRQGMVGQEFVTISGNNTFDNGFCIHSNEYVKLSSNNTFNAGTYVTMPEQNDLQLPASGFDSNVGLWQALDENAYSIRELEKLSGWIADLRTGTFDDPTSNTDDGIPQPSYITNTTPVTLKGKGFKVEDLQANRVNVIECVNEKSKINFSAKTDFRDAIIVTNCLVHFAADATMENVIFAVDNTDDTAFWAGADLRLGKDDSCKIGDDAFILTTGGFLASSTMSVYGSKVIAAKDIEFTANADGIEGASFIAGGEIKATSNNTMGFCDKGIDNIFQAEYFRMVM